MLDTCSTLLYPTPSKGEAMSQAKLSQLWGGGVMGKVMALLICFNVAILGFVLA